MIASVHIADVGARRSLPRLVRRSNLAKADLSEADLSDADLRNADLRGADLAVADLWRANLIGVCITPDALHKALQCRKK